MSKSFLQSSEWAKFQESVGHKTFRIENKLVIKNDLPLGLSYLYSPRPDFASDETLKNFLHESQKLAKSENSVFLRFEPDLIENLDIENYLKIKNLKFKIVHNKQPQDTLILDLNQTEETLLANMHQKTRYNIRLAEKHEIKIKKSVDPKDIDIFYNLAIKTAERDGFNYHSRGYYKKMMETLGSSKMVELYIAYTKRTSIGERLTSIATSDGYRQSAEKPKTNNLTNNVNRTTNDDLQTPIAAILVLFFDKAAIYLHGASDHSFRNLMAPYLLQWHAIKDAKNNSCKTYDFWGVSPAVQIPNPKQQIPNNIQNPNDQKSLEIRN